MLKEYRKDVKYAVAIADSVLSLSKVGFMALKVVDVRMVKDCLTA